MLYNVDMAKLTASSQKMLYNIMVTNIEICKMLGVKEKDLDSKLFSINPREDLGVAKVNDKKFMDPSKC